MKGSIIATKCTVTFTERVTINVISSRHNESENAILSSRVFGAFWGGEKCFLWGLIEQRLLLNPKSRLNVHNHNEVGR